MSMNARAPSILFVDDEPMLLEGVRRTLRQLRRSWRVECSSDPEGAIERMGSESFDCVVSDMRMPAMDGASLLGRVVAAQPGTIRFILSGQTDVEAAIRSIAVAHQFLSKPCRPDTLVRSIERSHDALATLDAETRARLLEIDRLPCREETLAVVNAMVESDATSMDEIASVMLSDVGMTTKVLQLASSSFFGSGCCIDCGRKATARLGKKVLRDVMARGTFRAGPLGRRRGEADPLEPAIGALLAELLDVRVERAPELSKAFVALWGIGLPD